MTKKTSAAPAPAAEVEGPTFPPTPLIPPTRAEVLYMKLADAVYSAIDTDTAKTIRERVLAGATEGEQTELVAIINERRAQYQ